MATQGDTVNVVPARGVGEGAPEVPAGETAAQAAMSIEELVRLVMQMQATLNALLQAGAKPGTSGFAAAAVPTVTEAPAVSRRWKIPLPPRFDGTQRDSAARSWLFTVDQYCQATGLVDPKECVRFIVSLLEGDALTWYRSLDYQVRAGTQPPVNDPTRFAQLFKAYYVSGTIKERSRRALKTIAQGARTVAEYNVAFNRLLVECGDLPADLVVSYYLDGLAEQLQAWVRPHNPGCLSDAQLMADRQEAILTTAKLAAGSAPGVPALGLGRPAPAPGPVPMDLNALADAADQPVCWFCKHSGHIKRNCDKYKKWKASKSGAQQGRVNALDGLD